MYEPPHFVETETGRLHGLMRDHPLGLLVSNGAGVPTADAVPFTLDAGAGGLGTLRAHVARANPHWMRFADGGVTEALVVFQGPQAYVSPGWYATKRETGKVVPTWNYLIVQARCAVSVHEDADWLLRQITVLTGQHEAGRAAPWAVSDAPAEYIGAQLRGIVGLELQITSLAGKWKASQNRPAADRDGVRAGLSTDGLDASALVQDR